MTQSLTTENTENGRVYTDRFGQYVGVAQYGTFRDQFQITVEDDLIGFFKGRDWFSSTETCDWMMLAFVAELEATGH